ncbi:MAG: hypothetical protein WHS46_10405 [Desulfosoma sp.]
MKPSMSGMRLDLEVVPNKTEPSRSTFVINWIGQETSSKSLLRCGSLEELHQVVQGLRENLENMMRQAEEAVVKIREQQERDEEKRMSPSDIWRQMEQAPTEEAMFACFNALSESKRLEVAEWVLTHVSMFKGRGPVFAEHYNIVTHTLDE